MEIVKIAKVNIEYKGAKKLINLYKSDDNNVFIDFNGYGETSETMLKTNFEGFIETSGLIKKKYNLGVASDRPSYKEKTLVVFEISELNLKIPFIYQRFEFVEEGIEEIFVSTTSVNYDGSKF